MVQLRVTVLLFALGLIVAACSHDKPANDPSNANSVDGAGPSGNAPSGNSRPTDNTMGTALSPDSDPSSMGAGPASGGSNGH